ncbi:response regulator transcription factor [Microbacterium enclense]|uniref:DNA-binding response regulator, OmpR family, contains REC and winged-helix (WHTH) domain n=1 Tax=Microbacterium enclense TaxID=993073 RepID=A0A1G6HND3_9MICO|nr:MULTISPECIES: response regulator transcription factor [Microbacterium]KSU55473.1 two-component system response regulator [Microbacterium enclense]SDB95817.1 DNA-binding response regulator, OmpR family, contains REC and winged-helix (wHTH) domain [Microbacterium enclense]
MSAAARVLVVDDDETIRLAVSTALRAEGFLTDAAADGSDLAERLAAFRPDLVVLDWMMPGPSGIRLLPLVRAAGDTAVIMLTARDEVDDRLRGFAEGADDYVVKPFTMAELVARAGAVLRRRGRLPQTISVGDLVVDPDATTAHRAGVALDLTATEFRLLHLLADGRGRTLSKAQILTQVWGYEDYDPNLVEVHLSALRRKMEQHGPRLIHTVRGLGYRLSAAT